MSPEGLRPPNYIEDTIHEASTFHGGLEGGQALSEYDGARESLTPEEIEHRRQVQQRARTQIAEVAANGHPYLLKHQIPAYLSALEHIASGTPETHTRTAGRLIEPTGYGKSALIIALSQDIGARTLIVTSRNNLVDQFRNETVTAFAPDLAVRERSGRTRLIDIMQPGADTTVDVELSNYLFMAQAPSTRLPKLADLVILDEGHNALGTKVREVLATYEQKALATIAATATPAYDNTRDLAKTYPLLIEKKTLIDGINEGFLSGIQIFAARTGIYFDDSHLTRGEYTIQKLEPLANHQQRNKKILDIVQHGLEHTGGTGLIRCIRGNGQQHARIVAEQLQDTKHPLYDRNIRAAAIGDFRDKLDKDHPDYRSNADIIHDLKAGNIDVVTTTEMATQGVDFKLLAFGADVSPRRSLLSLEQFMGRGMRLKENPFVFYQLIDEAQHHSDKLAYCWDVLGIEKPEQGIAVLQPGSRQHLVPKHTLPVSLQPFPERNRSPQRTIASSHIQEALSPENQERKTSLTSLEKQTNIARHILKRILFDNAYTFSIEENKDGQSEEHYPEEAAILLDYLVSRPEHTRVADVARSIGITLAKLEYTIRKVGFKPPEFYPHGAKKRAPLERHLTPEHKQMLQAELDRPRDPFDTEITLSEMGKLTGNQNFRAFDYFKKRGFTADRIMTKRGGSAYVYDRDEMMEYIDGYLNARPVPRDNSWTNVKDLATYHPDAREHHIFAAASIVGAPVTFFKVAANRRGEFVPAPLEEKILALLPRVIQYYEQEHAKAKAADSSYDRFRRIIPIPEVQDVLAETSPATSSLTPGKEDDIPLQDLEQSLPLAVHNASGVLAEHGLLTQRGTVAKTDAPEARKVLLAHVKQSLETEFKSAVPDSKPVPAEAANTKNIPKSKPYTQPSAKKSDPILKSAAAPTPILKPLRRGNPRQDIVQPRYLQDLERTTFRNTVRLSSLKVGQPINTLLGFATFHPHFSGTVIAGIDQDKSVVVDRDTYTGLFAAFHSKQIPTIPHSWLPAQQICIDHGIELNSYIAWLQTTAYTTDNLIPIHWDQETIFFCSPQLARASVEVYRQHTRRSQATPVDEDSEPTEPGS